MPVISIITINYNNKIGLKKTLESVIGQSCKNIEYIVIDGGSKDGSFDLINLNAKNISYWQSESDNGIYDAMNKGIAKAKGEYLLFLNSGDTLAHNKIIEEIIPVIQNMDIVYGDIIIVNEKNEKKAHKSFEQANVANLMISTIWHPCSFIKRELFIKYGLYNTDFKLAGDYEFYIRSILKYGVTSKYINKSIAEFDSGGISHQKENEALMNDEREQAWKLNFSDVMINFFKKSVSLSRSSEYKIGKLVAKFIS